MIQGPSDPSSFSCRLKRPICIAIWSLCIRFIFLVQFLLCTAQNIFFFFFLNKRNKKRLRQHTADTQQKCKQTFWASMRCAIGIVSEPQGRSPSEWWRGKAENWSSAATLQKKALRDTCTAKFMREKTETVSARSCKYYASIVVQWCFFLTTVYLIILLVRHCDEKTRAVI